MTMADIIQRFRDENPEIDANVISDSTLMTWCQAGDAEVCAKVRLINMQDVVITAIAGQYIYDLTLTNPLFFDIDAMPGSGVVAWNSNPNYKRLEKVGKGWMDYNVSMWRISAQGMPKYYWRYGQYLNVWPTPDSTITQFYVDLILMPNPFNNMNITPYNQLPYLVPFHYAIVLYLQWRAKIKLGKDEEGKAAFALYDAYVQWMIKSVGGGKYGPIEFRPVGLPYRGYIR